MSTVPTSHARVKPVRTIAVTLRPSDVNPFYAVNVVEKTARTVKSDTYFVRELANDLGRAFEMRKAGEEEPYHVLLSDAGQQCECKGFLKWGHCRHIEGLTALIQRGQLATAG